MYLLFMVYSINGTYKAQLPSIIITHWGCGGFFFILLTEGNEGREDFTDILKKI
jgi:hypothetical protein